MTTYRVVDYDNYCMAHRVIQEGPTGDPSWLSGMLVDLMVYGDFQPDMAPEELVGKRVTWDRSWPYILIAAGVKVVDEKEVEQ